MVNLPTQQLSPVPRTNALLFWTRNPSPFAFRRVACFSLANFIAKSSTPLINTWSGHTSNLVQWYVATAKVTSIQNGPTSNPTNRHHLNKSTASPGLHPTGCPCIRWNHCIYAACAPITGQVYTDQTAAAAVTSSLLPRPR
jgi:hypothetical protein